MGSKIDALVIVPPPLTIFAGGLLLLSRQIGQGQDVAPIVKTKQDYDAATVWAQVLAPFRNAGNTITAEINACQHRLSQILPAQFHR